jgi:hypothetical protein
VNLFEKWKHTVSHEKWLQMYEFIQEAKIQTWDDTLPLRLELWLKRRELDKQLDVQEAASRYRQRLTEAYARINRRLRKPI